MAHRYSNIHNPEPALKWYKFLIYILLFADAFYNGFRGLMAVLGKTYEDRVYYQISGLEYVERIYGAALLAVMVYTMFVRERLSDFHRKGPASYLALLLMKCAADLAYALAINVMEPSVDIAVISVMCCGMNMIATAIVYCASRKYFAKRANLFVNT